MIGLVPDQLPLFVVNVLPCCAVPEMAGGVLFDGAVSADAASPTAVSVAVRASTAPRAMSARRRRRGAITVFLSLVGRFERTPGTPIFPPGAHSFYGLLKIRVDTASRTLREP